jgi:hypothetical protein
MHTFSKEPIVIRRVGDSYYISVICTKCLRTKSRFLTNRDVVIIPDTIRENLLSGKTYINRFYVKDKAYSFYEILKDRINE